MMLEEAQGLVLLVCRLVLLAGGLVLILLGIRRLTAHRERRVCREAVILGFQKAPGTALSCPVVDLGSGGELRPVSVLALREHWKQQPGELLRVCWPEGDCTQVRLAAPPSHRMAWIQIIAGAALLGLILLRLLTA